MTTIKKGFEKQITEELVLKVAESSEEGERLATFNTQIHGDEQLTDYIQRLYNEHPNREEMLWFYIENQNSEEIVSSLALLPMKWKIRDHEFPVAEMGFVGTAVDYRGEGLFGIINNYYDIAMKERKYCLSTLVGIPYFYRKHGYEFVLSKKSGYSMPTNNIPTQQIDEVKVRKAVEEDLEFMEKAYNEYYKDYGVTTVFDKEKTKFRFMNSTSDTFNSISYIVEEDREAKGFFTIGSPSDPQRADIILVSDLTYQQMIKVLQFVKNYNMGNINAFDVNIHPNTIFGKYMKSIGADPLSEWTWQVKIYDLTEFLTILKPIIEERIEESAFAGINQHLKISDYSTIVDFHIVDGKIEEITSDKKFPGSDVDLRIPPPYFTRLFLSDKSFDELKDIITDALVKAESKLLIETIFPKIQSMPFSYYQ